MGSRSSEQHALLTDYDTASAYTQAFYTLFANIRFHWKQEQTSPGQEQTALTQIHTLLVTSAAASTLQATVAANLAIVAAQSGAETILVDADLRSPSMGKRFGLKPSAGLGDLLAMEEVHAQEITACLLPTFVPGLRVLEAGDVSARGAALLLSPQLPKLMTGLRDMLTSTEKPLGVVLFHSSPVLSGPGASLLGALADQTVLAVTMGQTTRTQARQAQQQLEQAHTKLAGVIMLHP